MRRWPPVVGVVLLAAGCNLLSRDGTLTARWITRTDTAKVSMPVTGTWCPGPGRLDLRATVGDTGLWLALYPSDSLALAGSYPVLEPGGMLQVRPAAGVALRWMGKAQLQGWWGDSGSVSLVSSTVGGWSGTGAAWLVSGLGPDSVTTLEFAFRGVRLRTDTLCDAATVDPPTSPDSGATPATPGLD